MLSTLINIHTPTWSSLLGKWGTDEETHVNLGRHYTPSDLHFKSNALEYGFSTSVLQEFLKHAISDYLVTGTELFLLKLLNLKK